MPDQGQRLTIARLWSNWVIGGCLVVWLVLAPVYFALVLTGEPVLPTPLNALVFVAMSTATVSAVVVRTGTAILLRLAELTLPVSSAIEALAAEIAQAREEQDQLAAEMRQRFDEARAQLEEARHQNTLELPRGAIYVTRGVVSRDLVAAAAPAQRGQDRRRSHRSRRVTKTTPMAAGPAPQQGPVPPAYLSDMSNAVELGRQIEAERRRRNPPPPD
jgi:hypothetical protein